MNRKILFICYWGLEDVLTAATVQPRLEILQKLSYIEEILLVTVERGDKPKSSLRHLSKVKHYSLFSKGFPLGFITKINDFITFPEKLARLVKDNNIDVVLAHGAPAGALAYKVWQQARIPFYVSSFEPHADYMAESKVWSKSGLKYIFQKRWERKQIKYAAGLMPVANSYAIEVAKKISDERRICTVPCTVNIETFQYLPEDRKQIRKNLGLNKTVVGIYVGKFGGLYYNEEAFQIYQQCFSLIPDFKLIILSPQSADEIYAMLRKQGISLERVYIGQVQHEEVPAYLSAADFAFATYKPGSSKKYLSPVKIGEYWANGLPILLTEGVGDDSDIINNEGGGATFNLQQEGSLEKALEKIKQIISDPNHRTDIPKLAQKYRSPERIREAYEYFFSNGR